MPKIKTRIYTYCTMRVNTCFVGEFLNIGLKFFLLERKEIISISNK